MDSMDGRQTDSRRLPIVGIPAQFSLQMEGRAYCEHDRLVGGARDLKVTATIGGPPERAQAYAMV